MPVDLKIRTLFSRERRNDWRRLLIQAQLDRVLIFPGKVPSFGIPLNVREATELCDELRAWLDLRAAKRPKRTAKERL